MFFLLINWIIRNYLLKLLTGAYADSIFDSKKGFGSKGLLYFVDSGLIVRQSIQTKR